MIKLQQEEEGGGSKRNKEIDYSEEGIKLWAFLNYTTIF